jgi:hypothetical protein
MAQSISKSQADALADGFFDTIGSSKDELQPKGTLSVLYQLAGGLVNEAQNNLNSSDRVASGALSASMKVLNPEQLGKVIRVDIEALYYYKFIDAGVKGTSGGVGQYSFKNNFVGRKMQEAIRKWLVKEGLKDRTGRHKPISKRETRRRSITETSRRVAFAIAKAVKKKGLKRTNFFSKALKSTKDKSKQELSKGFKIDIINSLPKKLL